MKRIVILAGPNGAGKTTFARSFLPREGRCLEFVNADMIAAGLSPFRPESVAVTAGRIMLARIIELTRKGCSCALETTLASRSYLELIPQWRDQGYRVELFFLELPDAEMAISRVAQRSLAGGHNIPPDVVQRRFDRGRMNLPGYISIVDRWAIFDASTYPVRLTRFGGHEPIERVMEDPLSDPPSTTPMEVPDYLKGALIAINRGAAQAIAEAKAAGLEPVILPPPAGSPLRGVEVDPTWS